MMKFRKKPVVIEAVHFNGINFAEVFNGFLDRCAGAHSAEGRVFIPTLEGTMCADKGDWIIRGVKGEYYPCKPDIFDATYEAVEEEVPA